MATEKLAFPFLACRPEVGATRKRGGCPIVSVVALYKRRNDWADPLQVHDWVGAPLQQPLGDAQRLLEPGLVQSPALGKIARAAALAADLGDGLLEDAAHVGRTAGGLSEE